MRVANPLAKRGENRASEYLIKKRYKIIERNFRKGYGEIDIIAIERKEREEILVFFEVKTRTSKEFGTPFEAITPWKIKFLMRTAQFYKLIHPELPDTMRIDAISIYIDQNGARSIEHVENITGF